MRLYLIKKRDEDAKKIVNNKVPSSDLLYEFYCESNQYDKACDFIKKYWQNNNIEIDDFIAYSFAMLKLGKYEEVYAELKKYYDCPTTCLPAIAINYFIAESKSKGTKPDERKINNKILEKK